MLLWIVSLKLYTALGHTGSLTGSGFLTSAKIQSDFSRIFRLEVYVRTDQCQLQLPGLHKKVLRSELASGQTVNREMPNQQRQHSHQSSSIFEGCNFGRVFRCRTQAWRRGQIHILLKTNSGFGSVAQARSADNRNAGFVVASLAIQLYWDSETTSQSLLLTRRELK